MKNSNIYQKDGWDSENSIKPIKTPIVSKLLRFKRDKIFLSNYEFNLKQCPKCDSQILLDDSFCYKCGTDVDNFRPAVIASKSPKVSKLLRFKRETVFLSNYDFNLKQCPKCNSELLLDDSFCYRCGEKVDLKNSNDY